MNLNKKKKYHKPAFSLIEIMTVIFIVAIGLVGTTQLIAQSLDAQMINKGGIVAYQLAQEGIEIVRQKRDTNWFDESSNWRTGLAVGIYCTDYRSPLELHQVDGLNDCPLDLDAQNWYYAPTVESQNFSGFRRVVEISDYDENSILVKATVSWNNRGRTIMYEAETLLYNWY